MSESRNELIFAIAVVIAILGIICGLLYLAVTLTPETDIGGIGSGETLGLSRFKCAYALNVAGIILCVVALVCALYCVYDVNKDYRAEKEREWFERVKPSLRALLQEEDNKKCNNCQYYRDKTEGVQDENSSH